MLTIIHLSVVEWNVLMYLFKLYNKLIVKIVLKWSMMCCIIKLLLFFCILNLLYIYIFDMNWKFMEFLHELLDSSLIIRLVTIKNRIHW